MAYAARQQGTQRTTAIGAVLVLHVVAGIVVVKEFSPTFFGEPNRVIEAIFVPKPIDTPPPPTSHPKAQPKPSPSATFTAPEPTFEIPPTGPVHVADPLPPIPIDPSTFAKTVGGGGDALPALFTPTRPSPANSPSLWATTADYPSGSLRLDESGTTGFRVTVGSDGRVKACEVLKSSGHRQLDDATCKLVSARARFDPAKDKHGETVVGTYSNSVRWVLPN